MNIHVRPLTSADAAAIRRLAFDTGFFGESMAALLDDPEIFEPSLDCYLLRDTSIGYVAEAYGRVVGYSIASLHDVTACTAVRSAAGLLAALAQIPWSSTARRRYVLARLKAALLAPFGEERRFRAPRGSRLHINVAAEARRTGAGSELMRSVLEELRERGIPLVHANSYQSGRNMTAGFWTRHGFTEVARVRTRAWRSFIPDEVHLVCFARQP